jgi:FKBP-type peptidyl-prolyl cis-trans isomerase
MKFFTVAMAGFGLLVASAFAADEKAAPKGGGSAELKDLKAKASYSFGQRIGKSMKSQSVDLDVDLFAKGLRHALEGKSQLTDEQIQEVMIEFQQAMQARAGELDAKRKKEGEEFLAANKKKPGVKTTASGLQYVVVKAGTGKTPKPTDTVTVNYEGRLLDGTVFDSSYKRGEPATFQVGEVIPGWTEALQLMKVGSEYTLYIPSDLAYRDKPRPGGLIRPNDTLIFKVELLDVK